MVETGAQASPKTDEERAQIDEPASHPAHVSAFRARYGELLSDVETLILRAMANSSVVEGKAKELQERIADAIDVKLPSPCVKLHEQFKTASLTAANFIDLKCLILRWRKQHEDPRLTGNTGILKRANWEGRKRTLFELVLAIQQAEGFKRAE